MIPNELYEEILIELDIDSLTNFVNTNKNIVMNDQFWLRKFKSDDVPLITSKLPSNQNGWIIEYKKSKVAKNKTIYTINTFKKLGQNDIYIVYEPLLHTKKDYEIIFELFSHQLMIKYFMICENLNLNDANIRLDNLNAKEYKNIYNNRVKLFSREFSLCKEELTLTINNIQELNYLFYHIPTIIITNDINASSISCKPLYYEDAILDRALNRPIIKI